MSVRYGKSYARIPWKNKTEPALNAINLGKVDSALNEVDNRTIELDSVKLEASEANKMITGFEVDNKTGIITVTYYSGSINSIPTNLNRIETNWDFDKKSQKMIIYLENGETKEVDLSAFITNYEFVDSNTICFQVHEDGSVSADILKGSITEDKLQPNFLADIKLEAAKAEQAKQTAQDADTSAHYYRDLAMSYTNGLSGIREGEETDNAKLYYEGAKAIGQEVNGVKAEIAQLAESVETNVETAVEVKDAALSAAESAAQSEAKAKQSEDSAAQSAATAGESKAAAEQSALSAKASEEAAAESAKNANQNALLAESYFHGGTGIREGEDEENVVALYEKVQAVADLDIATEAKAGLVKASDDVHVTTDGVMSVPKLSELENLIKGAGSAKVCETLEDMSAELNGASLADFTVGTNILIKAVGVPDFWISEVYTERLTFVFVSDEDLVNRVNLSEGTLQVGYYGISFLETDKVDLTGIAKESYVNGKFDEAVEYAGTVLDTAQEYTDSRISSAANNQQPTFLQAASRENIISGEKMSVILGKIRKWFSDLKTVAFSGSYNDLSDKPSIPEAVRVKGDSETVYRIGDVNITPENIGALSLSGNAKSATRATQDENGNNIVSTYLKKHGNEVLGADWKTNIRTKLKGNNEYSGYIARFRVDVPVEKLWQFGSTLVVGCGDTQFYLNVPYFKRNPWIGGGAREHIDWEEQLAFLSDLNQLKEEIGNSTVKQYTIQFAQGSAGTFTSEISMADKGFSQPPVVNFRGTNGNAGYYFDILDCTVNRVLVRVERRFGSGNDSDAFIAYIIGI